MKTSTKSLATATIAATALAGVGFGLAPNASAAADATKTVTKSFQQDCQTVGPFGPQTLGAAVTVTVPTAVKRNAAFSVTGAKIKVTVPASLNNAAYGTGARSQTVTFSVVNLNNVKITPATKDAVVNNITTARVPINPNQTTTFLAPKTGGLTVPLKAGTSAGTGTIKAGAVKATFQLYDASGAKLGGAQPVSCNASNVAITTIKIT